MKVFELIEALAQCDPSVDVVIASTPYGKFYNFIIKEQAGLALTEGELGGAVAFEVADEMSQYTLTLQG